MPGSAVAFSVTRNGMSARGSSEPPVHVAVVVENCSVHPLTGWACSISSPAGAVMENEVIGFSRSFGPEKRIT